MKHCEVCSALFDPPRKHRRWCTESCKAELKRRYDRERYPSIRAETIQRACQWQREHPDRKQAYDALYRESNREDRLEKKRKYSRSHPRDPYSSRLSQAKRRAPARFRVSPKDLRSAYHRSQGRCVYCSVAVSFVSVEWDHRVPLSRGGSHSIGNLEPSCMDCNRAKAHRYVIEWRMGRVVPRMGSTSVA